jgi:peptide/nickel transport system substrate-binding protein
MAESYWSAARRKALTRRRLLGAVAAGSGAILGSGLIACGGQKKSGPAASTGGQQPTAPAETARSGGTLNAYLPFNAPLDPQKASAQPQRAVAGVYSRLFRFKAAADPKVINNHDLESDLALSAETTDATTWTIKLRPDAKFANIAPVNGHAVEAEDVKSSFMRALDQATPNPNRGQIGMIDPTQIQTPDKTTVVFKLKFPYAPFNRTLASPAYSLILPREALAGSYDPAKVVIGSGPFTLESFAPDVAYVYKRNPDYFVKGQPHVDGMRIAVVPDASQQLAQFSAGNIDEYLPGIDDLETAKQRNPKATVIVGNNGSPNPVFWQMGDPSSVFQDVRVRRAFSMALDRDALAKVIYGGQAVASVFIPTYMGKWSLGVGDLDQSVGQYYKYNPTEAKKLLEAAGATNLQLRFAMVVNGPGGFAPTPIYRKQAETINNMLNAVGTKTNLVSIDYNKDYVDSGKGSSQGYYDKDMIIDGGFSPYTEADEWLYSYFHSKSTNSHTNVKDPTLDAMIDKERTIIDEAQRVKAVLDIQRYVADKLYILASVGPYQYNMVQPRVKDYAYSDSLGYMTESYSKLWLSA